MWRALHNVLEYVVWIRIDLLEKLLGLLEHDGVMLRQHVAAKMFIEGTIVLFPPGTIRHQTKIPSEAHPSHVEKVR